MSKQKRRPQDNSVEADSVPSSARLNIGFVLANHFTLTAFANFVDALRLAADEGDRSRQIHCRWRVMSSTANGIRASCGLELIPDSRLRDPAEFHYIVVVGGLLHQGPQVDSATESWLRRAAAAGTPLVGVCTGPFVLKRLGLLEGRRVCVSWYHRQDFLDEFGVSPITDSLFTIDGDRITCSGGAGVLDLAITLIDRHVGSAAARKSLNVLQLDRPRGGRDPQPTPHLVRDARDERVRRASLAMEQNLSHPLSIAAIADRIGLSPRQLDRLFRGELNLSPAECYRQMRLEYGRWLLQETNRSIVDVATQAGFSDGAHFSRAFRAHYGYAPSNQRDATRTKLSNQEPRDRRLFL